MQEGDVCNPYILRLLWCSLYQEMNHADLKKRPALCASRLFSWTVRTGLEEMQLKIETDESGRRRGSREQVPAAVSGVPEPLAVSAFKI